MDFFAGVRPLLFSYVLINGILITLQTKEGERLFLNNFPRKFLTFNPLKAYWSEARVPCGEPPIRTLKLGNTPCITTL